MKKRKGPGWLAAIALAMIGGQAAAAPDIPKWADRLSEGIYRVPAGQTRMIERFGNCRTVTNSGSDPMMIPAGSSIEWATAPDSFLMTGSRQRDVQVGTCPDYFYIVQGCVSADHGRGECMVRPAAKREIPENQIRNRFVPACRSGSRNYGTVYFRGNLSSGTYHPLSMPSYLDNVEYYGSETWAGGGAFLDQNGSMVIPMPWIANKLFGSTVDYSGRGTSGKLGGLGWYDDNLVCQFLIVHSLETGGNVGPEWGDQSTGGGRRRHSGHTMEGGHGASIVQFKFVRTPGVPSNITADVVDRYMVDVPPDPPS